MSHENETHVNESNPAVEAKAEPVAAPDTLVDAVFDALTGWAVVGLRIARSSLEETSRALAKTAHALDGVSQKLAGDDEKRAA